MLCGQVLQVKPALSQTKLAWTWCANCKARCSANSADLLVHNTPASCCDRTYHGHACTRSSLRPDQSTMQQLTIIWREPGEPWTIPSWLYCTICIMIINLLGLYIVARRMCKICFHGFQSKECRRQGGARLGSGDGVGESGRTAGLAARPLRSTVWPDFWWGMRTTQWPPPPSRW